MKKALFTLAALAMASSAFAQGHITSFSNADINNANGIGTYNAPIFMPDGVTLAAAGSYTVGLYAGSQLLGTGVLLADGLYAIDGDVAVNGAAPGSTVLITEKVWQTGKTFETSAFVGITSFTSQPLGGPNPNPPPPSIFTPGLTGLQSVTLVPTPEPSTIALGALGVGALLLRRRK